MSKAMLTKEDLVISPVSRQTMFKLRQNQDEEFQMLAMIEVRKPAGITEDGAEGRLSISGLGLAKSLNDDRLLIVTEGAFRNGDYGVVATHRNRWGDIWGALRSGILPNAGSIMQSCANAGITVDAQTAAKIAQGLMPHNNVVRNALDTLNGLDYDDNGFPRRRGGCGMIASSNADFLNELKALAYEKYLDVMAEKEAKQQQSTQQQVIPQAQNQAVNTGTTSYSDNPF